VKVGLFVIGLTIVAALTIFIVGGSAKMFAEHYTLRGSWEDVAGLKEGAVVRLAGWDVGEVTAIQFSDDLGVKEIFVTMKVMNQYQSRIREDSVARIDTVGVLGDKYVAISMGSTESPTLEDQSWIVTNPALDVLEYTKKVTDILNSTSSIGNKVDLMLGGEDEAARASLSNSFKHLEGILREAEEGSGLIHALVYDETLTRRVNRSLANLELASEDLRSVTNEIRQGDGLANELIYGDDGATLARELGELAGALSQLTSDLRNDESLLHSIMYDPSKADIIDDLAQTVDSLRETSLAIESGDGTLGMLTRDPALYEDLRSLVGGAQRNKLLRAYIRRTVAEGEQTHASPWEPAE